MRTGKPDMPTHERGSGAAKRCWDKGGSTLPLRQQEGGKAHAVSYDFISKGICQELGWQRCGIQEASRICSSCCGRIQGILEKWSGAAGPWRKPASQCLSRETLPLSHQTSKSPPHTHIARSPLVQGDGLPGFGSL